MKTFKQLIAEVAQPNNEDELNFKAKHSIEVTDYPASEESQHSAEKKSPRRRADYAVGEDEDVYEAKKLDPVGKENGDIDNDGDKDDSDEFLAARRAAIAKAIEKEKEKDKKSGSLEEKAVSQAQQQAAGVALAVKRGDKPKSALVGASKDMYKMSEKDLEDFAKTKHKGLPEKITEANASKIIASLNAGDSIDVTVQKNLNKKGDNKDEILKVIRDYNWKKRMKKESVDRIDEATPTKKDITMALQSIKAQPKEKVTLKKAPWDKKNEEVNLDEDATLDQIRAILTKKNDGTKVVKDKSGYFHIKTANSHKGPFHTMKDVLADLSESALIPAAAVASDKGKKKFKLDDKEFPVTIDPKTAKKIVKNLDENFKVGIVKLNDGSSVIIKESDAKLLNQLIKELSGPNRDAMMNAAMKNKNGFNEILGFAKEAL